MPNTLKSVDMPGEVTSGKKETATATYSSAKDGTLSISNDDGYNVTTSPDPVKLPKTQTEASFTITVTRTTSKNKTCQIAFSAFGDTRTKRPVVKPVPKT